MVETIINMLNFAVTNVGHWFGVILSATGMADVYIGNMVVVLTMGILLAPLLGSVRSGASDYADSFYKKGRSDDVKHKPKLSEHKTLRIEGKR